MRPDFSNFKKSEETALENSLLFTFTTICFEDSSTCGCDTTDSVRYHLRANKIDLSLKWAQKNLRTYPTTSWSFVEKNVPTYPKKNIPAPTTQYTAYIQGPDNHATL